MSTEYEARGLTAVCVDNEQIGALHTENNRERVINENLQKDVEMLSKQFEHGENIRKKQEIEIAEQQAKILDMNSTHQFQINENEVNY